MASLKSRVMWRFLGSYNMKAAPILPFTKSRFILQYGRRCNSKITSTDRTSVRSAAEKFYFREYQQQIPTQSRLRRALRNGIYYSLISATSALVTFYLVETYFPISFPETGSSDDLEITEVIKELANELEIVKQLKTEVHPDGTKVWEDWDVLQRRSWRDGSVESSESRTSERAGLSETLRGTARVSLNWRWWDEKQKRLCCIVYLGWAVSGWPRMVHGGMLATLLDEALGITAISSFPAKTGVTANLKVQYLKPTRTEQFIVITTDLVEGTDKKALVKGEVMDLDGNVLVSSAGVFVVPKKLILKPLMKDTREAKE